MLSFDIEEENLEKLIEEKREEVNSTIKIEKDDDQKIYPLFRNYPNGTSDYYLKLKSIDYENWKNELKIIFLDKTIIGDKYYYLLKKLGFRVLRKNNNRVQASNYNLVITNSKNLHSELMTDVPVIYINCSPFSSVDKKHSLFYYDNEKYCRKHQYYFLSNEVKFIYRKNASDFIDAISKLKEENE